MDQSSDLLPALLARQAELERRVEVLEAAARPPLPAAGVAVVAAIHAAAGASPFTLPDLLQLATFKPGLAVALAPTVNHKSGIRRLGALLARASRSRCGDYVVERLGRERRGTTWRVSRIHAVPVASLPRTDEAGYGRVQQQHAPRQDRTHEHC